MNDDYDVSILYALSSLQPVIRKDLASAMESGIQREDLKFQHMVFITYIGSREGVSQKELNQIMPYDKSYTSIMVRNLIQLGLIENRSSGRYYSLFLTSEGRDLFDQCKRLSNEVNDRILNGFTEDEVVQFQRFLLKVRDNLANKRFR